MLLNLPMLLTIRRNKRNKIFKTKPKKLLYSPYTPWKTSVSA